MLKLQPYQARPIRFLGLWQYSGWTLKLYGIAYRRLFPRPSLVDAAKTVARQRLPLPAVTRDRYGVGFLGIHDGRGVNFVFVDWWANENELCHHVYTSPTGKPGMLEYTTPTGVMVCVWDLRVLTFEREAWMEAVLTNPEGPDLDEYLARHLNEDI